LSDDFERSQPASQLARFGVIRAKGRRRSGDRDDLSARNLLRNLLALV
jgi:hypothetical protein